MIAVSQAYFTRGHDTHSLPSRFVFFFPSHHNFSFVSMKYDRDDRSREFFFIGSRYYKIGSSSTTVENEDKIETFSQCYTVQKNVGGNYIRFAMPCILH